MTCEEYQLQISQYVDNELGDRDAGVLFAHLGSCATCRGFLQSVLQLRSAIQDDILKESESWEYPPEQASVFTTTFTLPFVALLIVLFLFFGLSRSPSQQESILGGPPIEQVRALGGPATIVPQ